MPLHAKKTPHFSLPKYTLTIVICLLSAGLINTSAYADNKNGMHAKKHSANPYKSRHKMPDFSAIVTQLQLTEEQAKQLEPALNEHRKLRKESRQALRQKHKKEKRELFNTQKQKLDENLKKFLSSDQINQLHGIIKKNKPFKKRHHRKQLIQEEQPS